MSSSIVCRRIGLYRLSRPLRTYQDSRLPTVLPFPCSQGYATSADNLPRVAQPSIWHSIIPKAFRERSLSEVPTKSPRSKEWNPATFFIWIFLLIGSNGIQMLTLRNEYSTFSRKSDQKIKLLKEVIEKVQRGEDVDVEKVLGTGDETQEHEWKDVIKDIEEEDIFASKDRRRERRRLNKQEAQASETAAQKPDDDESEESFSSVKTKAPPQFY